MTATKFHISPDGTDARTASITVHSGGDRIAQAIMATPNGGPKVEILIDGERHSLDHWSIQTVGGIMHLVATWVRNDYVPARAPVRDALRSLWRRVRA